MQHISEQGARTSLGRLTTFALVAALLSACGGGGGSPGIGGAGAGTGTGTGTGTTAEPTVRLALADSSGAAVTSLSGGHSAAV